MADAAAAPQQPVRLTQEEKKLYGQLFRIADSEQLGVITGAVAVEFFKKSKLTPTVLAEIWALSDTENQGFLTQKTWSIALRLIAHAQQGEKPTTAMASRPGPPYPVFDGIQLPTPQPQAPPTPTPAPVNRIPPLTSTDRERYRAIFANARLQNGLIDGEQARTIFLRGRLPNEVLGQIWALADTHNRGALDITEFIIAMHLIQSLMANRIAAVPATLPSDFLAAASAPFEGSVKRSASVSSSGSGRAPMLPPKIQQSPIRAEFTGGSQAGGDWDVTPQDKAYFDSLFNGIDKGNKGFIDGNEAVGFFLTSELPEDLLAHIWDLADIPKRGSLTRDTFAVAMYLIRSRVAGKELPAVLPASLIPPSLRQTVPAPPPAPPALQQPQPSSAAQDLFGLDDAFAPSTQGQGSPAPAFIQGVQSPTRTLSPQIATSSPKPSSPIISTPLNRPFQPTSSFGRGIAGTNEPISTPSPPPAAPAPAPAAQPTFTLPMPAPIQVAMQSGSVFGDGDLLGDADPEISQKLTAETTELANLSNQIGSLNTATRDLQSNKAKAEAELATVSQQKRDIEARLKLIRTLYDEEVKNVRDVEAKLASVRGEVGKNRQEVTVLEASLHALQNQFAEQRAVLQKDQAENSALKGRIVSVGEEIKALKDALEKVKREARQQRGLVAINKKQLTTIEGERDKIQGEIETEKKSIEQMQAEAAAAQREREVISPTLSDRSQGTNPFLRMHSTGEAFPSPSVFASPPIQTFSPFDPQYNHPFQTSGVVLPEPVSSPFPPTQKPEPTTAQSRESSEEQHSPPSIASAFSPPLQAREFSNNYAESATSSLAVNPPVSSVPSVNGDISVTQTPDLASRAVGLGESAATSAPAPRDGPVIPEIQEMEVKESDSETSSPKPLQQTLPPIYTETVPVTATDEPSSPHHGPRSADAVTSDIVQETLSHPPHDEDLTMRVTRHEQKPFESIPAPEPSMKPEEASPKEDTEGKSAALPGGFPSESSDEGRESWVDLGDESKSVPSEQIPRDAASVLPPNRSDPFAFGATTSAPPRMATKEDFDAAFSSFGSFGKKEENGVFRKDFDTEFPPIEEFGGNESDSEGEPGGFDFKDNFAEKAAVPPPAETSTGSVAGESIETPMQQTLPVMTTVETTAARSPPPVSTPNATAPLQEIAPPVPPKDFFSESSAPPITPSETPPDQYEKPPAYSNYANLAESSAGSNDLSGLLPSRDPPPQSDAPYMSPPPREAIIASPTPFTPVKPVSFSPPLSDDRRYSPPGPIFPTTAPSTSPKLEPSPAPPLPPKTVSPSASAPASTIPTIQEPKSPKPMQTFAAFDFSGLQEAAPLDDSQDNPFRLSTRSDTFGEFDTTFDSAPVTPAKHPDPFKLQKDDFSDFGFDVPPDFASFPAAQTHPQPQPQPQPQLQQQQLPPVQQPQQSQGAPLSLSSFDDVFASFDRAPALTPPALPARGPSPDDDPNLKTLTEMGFSRAKSVEALEKHNYNLTNAMNYLLGES